MKSLLLGLRNDLSVLQEKLKHQCTVLSRQLVAVERLTNPGMVLSNGSLKPLPPPYGDQLKAAEDAVIAYLDQKRTGSKNASVEDQSLMPVDPKLPLLTNLISQTCSKYLCQRTAQIVDWRASALVPIMEGVLGPVSDSDISEPAWLQVSDGEMESLWSSIATLKTFEHPLARSGTDDEGFLASFLRDIALEQGGFRSFRSRLVLSKDEWKDLIKCLSAGVVETVLGLYKMVEATLEAALLLDLSLQEKMRLVRMATDATSLSLYLTRDEA